MFVANTPLVALSRSQLGAAKVHPKSCSSHACVCAPDT